MRYSGTFRGGGTVKERTVTGSSRAKARGRRRTRWWTAAAAAALLLAGQPGCGGGAARKGLDSVLLITVDTLRADHLSCYDPASPVKTIAIDALAASGALVEDAWCTVPITAPSHASILTGLSPLAHGVRNNYRYRLPRPATTLAEILEDRGAATAAFIASYTASREFGLDQGFALFDDGLGYDDEGRPRSQRPGGEVVDRAAPWIENHGGEPFMAWVHLFDPHSPYDPPAEFRQQYGEDLYSGEVAYTDFQVARLLEALERSGARDNTVVVLIADHGEALGAHGEAEHGMLLYQPTLHVPFLIRAPGHVSPGTRIDGVASGIDVVPTLLSLLGLPPSPKAQGLDLLSGPIPEDRAAYAESIYAHEELGWSPLYSLRQGRWSYTAAPEPELYDLTADPGQHHNLAAERPEQAASLASTLDALQKEWLDRSWAEQALGAGAGESAEDLERLASLGYAAGGGGEQAFDPLPPVRGRNPVDNLIDYQVLIRAQHLILAGQPGPAVKMLQRLNRDDPGNPQYMLKLALALENQGNIDAADQAYRKLVEAHPSFLIGHRFYGAFLEQHARVKQARDLWLAFVRAYPGAVGAEAQLAHYEIAAGNPAAAAERLEVYLDGEPGDQAAWTQLGIARTATEETELAFGAFQRALELKPGERKARQGLAALAEQSGEKERARELIERLR